MFQYPIVLLIQILNINVNMVFTFKPEIQMPFKKISGSSTTEVNKIGSTLTCDKQRNSLKDCATECFNRSLTHTGCPGFYKGSNQNETCNICYVSSYSQIQANSFTTFNFNDDLYLLKSLIPDTDIEMNFDNYTETTIYGKGTEGTKANVVDSDHVVGIKGQGLYVHSGSHVILTGSGSECWTNLNNCSSGFSVSFWFQAKAHLSSSSHILGSGVSYDKGFNFQIDASDNNEFKFNVFSNTRRYRVKSISTALVDQWHHLVGVFDGNGVQLYVDGTDSGGAPASSGGSATDSAGFGAHLGVGFPHKGYPTNAYLDQFKVYYKLLNTVGKLQSL